VARDFVPDHSWSADEAPVNAITERHFGHPAVAYTVDRTGGEEALVVAIRNELIVRRSAAAAPAFSRHLKRIATRVGSLAHATGHLRRDDDGVQPPTTLLADDVELWVIKNPTANSPFDEVVALSARAPRLSPLATRSKEVVEAPAVAPNHVFVACKLDSCPGGPPSPIGPLPDFIPSTAPAHPVKVVVIDSGYVESQPPKQPDHKLLDHRTTSVPGLFLDSTTGSPTCGQWVPCPPDGALEVPDQPRVLDGVAGHGTFVAGLIAHRCPEAFKITAVGERRAIIDLNGASETTIFSCEFSVARSLHRYSRADVISCGFAFPTFRNEPPTAMTVVLAAMADAPAATAAVVVAPAGNEYSERRYWPAAHPDVIGVAATDADQDERAVFAKSGGRVTSGSNWSAADDAWVTCCCRGQAVESIFIDWSGDRTEDGPPPPQQPLTFKGWARWDGTSFAAPKVTAAIANFIAQGHPPQAAFGEVVKAHGAGLLGGVENLRLG
jgi:subtilisin family serine protease